MTPEELQEQYDDEAYARAVAALEQTRRRITWGVLAALTAVLLLIASCEQARAFDHGFDKNDPKTKWMEMQCRPDMPDACYSCCGKADAYAVKRYQMHPDGSATAWVEKSDNHVFPDGELRPAIDEQEISVPAAKVNPLLEDRDNPFDWSVIWLTVQHGKATMVWCFVRHPQGS